MDIETFQGGIWQSILSIACVVAIGLVLYYSIGG
jgi:hypothetical protein